jgi:LysR family transcriptional regulator, low CO2-responsive transcriptional regulator
MLNLHHLHLLRTVAEEASVSRAAERLGISQPAVSMQLKKLEESVGVPLVETRGRSVALTVPGRSLADYAERLLRLSREAEEAMEDYRTLRRGRLRIAASSTPGAYLLPATLAAFGRTHPDVSVSLEVSNTRHALGLVAGGLADLAVVGEADPQEFDVRLTPLCEDRLTVVVAPSHPWAQRRQVTGAELAAEPLILREEGSNTRAVLDRRLGALGLRPRVGLELGSTEAVKEAVAAGLGAAVISGLAVRWDLASGRMTAVAAEGLDLVRRLFLADPAAPHTTQPLAARFAAHLQSWAANQQSAGGES